MNDFLALKHRYQNAPSDQDHKRILIQLNRLTFTGDQMLLEISDLAQNARHADVRLLSFLVLRKSIDAAEKISHIFKLELDICDQLVSNETRVVRFPAIGAGGGSCIAEALVIKFAGSPEHEPLCLDRKHFHDAKKIARALGCCFFVAFNQDFEGNSWMCAVAAALLSKDQTSLDRYLFSGILSDNGKIQAPANLEDKKICAESLQKRLISSSVSSVQELEFWLNANEIPVPFIQFSGKKEHLDLWYDKMEAAIKKDFPFYSLHALEEWFGLKIENLTLYQEGSIRFDQDSWREILKTAYDKFDQIEFALHPKKAILWYAGKVSSLQFGLGVCYGFKRPVCICQYDSNSQEYEMMLRLYGKQHPRILKNVSIKPQETKYLNYELNITPGSDDLKLIIYLGSHNLKQDVREYEVGSVCDELVIHLKEDQGFISFEQDWVLISQEINSLLNHIKNQHSWKRVHVFQSAPTAICFALGIALGHFLPYYIYHYQPEDGFGSYKMVYRLDIVQSFD